MKLHYQSHLKSMKISGDYFKIETVWGGKKDTFKSLVTMKLNFIFS